MPDTKHYKSREVSGARAGRGETLRQRTIKKDGHLINVAVMSKPGPRGGKTVATSIRHPKHKR